MCDSALGHIHWIQQHGRNDTTGFQLARYKPIPFLHVGRNAGSLAHAIFAQFWLSMHIKPNNKYILITMYDNNYKYISLCKCETH